MSKAAELAALIGSQTALSNRNLIINGAMQVAQRGTSATGKTTSGYYAVDRMETLFSALGTWTIEQSTDAPDGFSNSFKMTATAADASPSAGDYAQMRTSLEGNSLQQLKYGTSGALATTVSFWVKATKTGSFTLVARNFDGNTRMFSKNVSVSAANTWEYKTVTIPGDTGDTLDNDNGTGLELAFWVNAGSTFSGGSEMSTWAAQVNANKYLGTIDIGASVNDAIQFTGFQFEVGEQATPFEHRSYADELRRCQRYYHRLDSANGNGNYYRYNTQRNTSSTGTAGTYHMPVTMRVTPSVSTTGTASNYAITHTGGNTACSSTPSFGGDGAGPDLVNLEVNVASGLTSGQASQLMSNNNKTSFIGFDAEL